MVRHFDLTLSSVEDPEMILILKEAQRKKKHFGTPGINKLEKVIY